MKQHLYFITIFVLYVPTQTPMVFMSDDSSAEKNSLHSVWPSANQFLCHFHMTQAKWRWLHNTKNGITLADRCSLMKLFQKVKFIIVLYN